MKNLYKALLISLLGSIFCSSVKADINYVTNYNSTTNNYELYKSTSSGNSQKLELLTTLSKSEGDMSGGWFDASQSKFYFAEYDDSSGYSAPTGKTKIYDLNSNTWSLVTLNNDSPDADPHFSSLTFSSSVVTEENNGTISIGENSLKLKETGTTQEMWATNSSGSIAPINITNGTKLLINGRDVEQSIDNVGALSAALTGLPTIPTDSPIACGIGTGTHSGNYAFSGGCATKVNDKLSFNAAASFVPGQDYQGTDNSYSARAGFVLKLGKIEKPNLISFKDKKIIDQKISSLEKNNKKLKEKNDEIISQNQKLLARLEKLENIALKIQSTSEMISFATKD